MIWLGFLYFNIGTYLRSRQYAFYDFEKKAFCCIMESSDNDIFYSYSIIYDFCCIFVYYMLLTEKNL